MFVLSAAYKSITHKHIDYKDGSSDRDDDLELADDSCSGARVLC